MPAPRPWAAKARVSFGEGASSERGEAGPGSIPRAIAQELRADGSLCNLPPPSDDDIAKMQWMGDLEATPDSDDDDAAAEGAAAAAERGGGAEMQAARRIEKLARRKVEGLRFDFDGRLVDPARSGAAEAPSCPAGAGLQRWLSASFLCRVSFDARGGGAGVSTSEGLHHHGEEPTQAGYTIPELLRLSRSAFTAQV